MTDFTDEITIKEAFNEVREMIRSQQAKMIQLRQNANSHFDGRLMMLQELLKETNKAEDRLYGKPSRPEEATPPEDDRSGGPIDGEDGQSS